MIFLMISILDTAIEDGQDSLQAHTRGSYPTVRDRPFSPLKCNNSSFRFAIPRSDDNLINSLKGRVLEIVGAEDVELYWKGISLKSDFI